MVPHAVPLYGGHAAVKPNKLIIKALGSPTNIRFRELCNICEMLDMKARKQRGSHVIYKRNSKPKFTISIQDDNGMAKQYQVEQVLSKSIELGLLEIDEEQS